MVTGCKGWKEAALERIYIHNYIYVCITTNAMERYTYATANRIWLPPGSSKELMDPGGLRWDFAFSESFFPPTLPHFCGQRDAFQRECLVCHKRVHGWLRNPLLSAEGDNVDSSNGNVTYLLARNYAPDQQKRRYAWFLRTVCTEHIRGDACRSVRCTFIHAS